MTNDLRTAALAAYEEQQTVERERREEQAKSAERAAAARFRAIFGVDAAGVATHPPDGPTMVYSAEGLSFQWYDRNLYLFDECPLCGEYCMGQLISNLELLGEALAEGFAPNYTHNCHPVRHSPPDFLINAVGLIGLAVGRDGLATPRDAAALGQLYALIAIAQELGRANDRLDRLDDRQDAQEHR